MDDEAAALLDEHPDDNHSKIIRELLKAYYTAGVYDTEEAAIDVRKRELKRQVTTLTGELESIQNELERLEELSDSSKTSDVETVAETLHIVDPDKATVSNPAIQNAAARNGIDEDVLAEEVKTNAIEQQYENLESAQPT